MVFFFFNDTATTEIYTLSLHDALPILTQDATEGIEGCVEKSVLGRPEPAAPEPASRRLSGGRAPRSEEHTSELQSRQYLVCRLLLEKKNHETLGPQVALPLLSVLAHAP